MKFNQIIYFLRSCETLNFTRAAELCHVSQPALSAAIHNLEDDLGGALFDRHKRSLSLTPLGESMRIHLGQIEQARRAASLAASRFNNNESDVINLGLMCTLSPHQLLSAMASFSQSTSNTELLVHDVWESKALELLISGALDCIILAHTDTPPEQFEIQHLVNESMVLAMHKTHPLATQESVSFADLKKVSYVDRLRCEFRHSFFDELNSRDIEMHVVLRSEREDLISESISNAIGIATMPQYAAEHAGLITRKLDDMSIERSISIVSVKDRELNPAVAKFIEHVLVAYNDTEIS